MAKKRKIVPQRGVRKNGMGGRGVGRYAAAITSHAPHGGHYRLTPKRRAAIIKAQRVSARKRKGKREKDTVGYWIAKGVRKGASKATFGASGAIVAFMEQSKAHKRKRR